MTDGAEHVFGGHDPAQHLAHDLPGVERGDGVHCRSRRHPIPTARYQRPRLSAAKHAVPVIFTVLTLLLSACDLTLSGYNEPRGYDGATLKFVFSMDAGQCLNRFTYDSKLAPSHPQVVPCERPDARLRNDGFHANAPGCTRIDYESITQNGRAFYCLKYLVRVGYCYPALTRPGKAPVVLLYAPSACDESLRMPEVANLVPDSQPSPPENKFTRFIVTNIKTPGPGQHCDSVSVDLDADDEEARGSGIPPAISQLVCLAPK